MARIFGEGSGKGIDAKADHLEINDAGAVKLPNGIDASSCEFTRDGQDLVLTTADGQVFVVENYFSMPDAPVIISESGALLSPALVLSFIKPAAGDVQVAANEQTNDASPVGEVTEVSGEATVTHSDGTKEKISAGTQIFEGDIVETDAKGAVNIKFADDSTFAVSENARLAVDDFSFNAADQSGTTGVSILRGVFMFTSGLIGRENPDAVTIETPVGSIGIRGTIIGGSIQEDGHSTISVIEGAIVVRNGTGEQILSQQFETVTLTGYSQPITNVGTMDAGQMTQTFGSVRPVSPTLFTSIDDTSHDRAQPQQQTQPETQQQQTQPETQPQSAAPEAPQAPVQQMVVLNETPVFQTLTTGSNIENTLGAPLVSSPQAPVVTAPTPVLVTPPQTTIPPQQPTQPVQDVTDRRPPSAVAFVSGGSYAENNAVGAEVGRVEMTDATMRFPVRYELLNNTGPFTIDNDGRIFATASGNYEIDPHDYNFTVRVTRLDTNQTSETPLAIHLTNVDEAPVFGNTNVTVAEGSFVYLNPSMVGATDPEGDTANLTYTVVGQVKGVIQVFDGTAFSAASSFTQAQLAGGAVKFFHNGDEPGSGTTSLTLRATDATGHVSAEKTTNFTVTPTNDAPVLVANAGGTVLENSTTLITGSLLNHTDSDNSPSQVTYTVVSVAHGAAEKYNGTTWVSLAANDTFTQADVNDSKIRFTQNGDENGQSSLVYRVGDGTYQSANKELVFNITNVNDTPVEVNHATPTVAEDGTLGITSSMLSYSDDDIADTASDLVYTLTAQDHGHVQLFNGAWANVATNGTFTQDDIDSGKVRFVHDGDEQDDASFSYTLTDGHIATPIAGTFNIDVTPVNDAAQAPSISTGATLAERGATGATAESLSTITITDGENPASNPDYSFAVERYNGTAWVADNRFEVFDNSGLWELRAKANTSFDHETESSIQLRVQLTDGSNATVTSGTLNLSITDINEVTTAFKLNDDVLYDGAADFLMSGEKEGAVLGVLKSIDVDTTNGFRPTADDYRITFLGAASGSLNGLQPSDFEFVDSVMDGKNEVVLKLRDGLSHHFGPNDVFNISIQLDADQNGVFGNAADIEHSYTLKGRNDTMILEFVDGKNGFHIDNDARPGAYFANDMAVGDYNNDGRPDLVFGAPRATNGTTEQAGGFYAIAGGNGLITSASNGHISLNAIVSGSPSTRFFQELTTSGNDANANYGAHVALIRNFNGGGVSLASVNPNNGVVEVFQNGTTTGMLTISNIPHNGSNTFDKLTLGSVGDINGDGFDDLLIGSQTAANFRGTVGIVLGNASQSDINFQTQASSLLNGSADGELFGGQIAGLGDINGDGRADFAVSSSNADTGGASETGQGRVTVYFGSNDISTLNTNKFVINGSAAADQTHLGSRISGAGDFNGDGLQDLLIRNDTGVTLVYGDSALQGTSVDLGQLNGLAGFNGVTFNVPGMPTADKIGGAISSAGDFNGDGYDDIVIDYAKSLGAGLFEHTLFVVYGSASPLSSYDLDALRSNESAAYKIRLLNPAGETLTLAAAGDFNGDGYDDFLVGDPSHSNSNDAVHDGSATMIYGNNYDGAATNVVGTAAVSSAAGNESYVGDHLNNTVNSNAFTGISFRGGDGDDTFILNGASAGLRNFDGGAGKDTLRLFFSGEESSGSLDLINLKQSAPKLTGVDVIQFDASSQMDVLMLDIRDVLTLAQGNEDHRLLISAGGSADGSNSLQLFLNSSQISNLATNADNTLRFTNDADHDSSKDTTVVGGVTYSVYTHTITGAELLVDTRLQGAGDLAGV